MSGPAAQEAGWAPDDDRLAEILRCAHTVAVVGLSDKPDRPSNQVARYLQAAGYRVVPVNPSLATALGEVAYPSLAALPFTVDVVDVFRRPGDVPAVVAAAARMHARVLWLQEGVVNIEAAEAARAAGLEVVMDRCMLKERERLRAAGRL